MEINYVHSNHVHIIWKVRVCTLIHGNIICITACNHAGILKIENILFISYQVKPVNASNTLVLVAQILKQLNGG